MEGGFSTVLFSLGAVVVGYWVVEVAVKEFMLKSFRGLSPPTMLPAANGAGFSGGFGRFKAPRPPVKFEVPLELVLLG